MGRVLAPFGVRGWVKVEPFTEHPEALARFASWWLAKAGEWREVAVAEWARHDRRLVVRFEGCASPEEAVRYRGSEIAVPREALPELGANEYYRADLIGLRVVNRAGEELGRIEGLLENGAHPVMSVRWEGGERLLPLAGNVVERIDLQAGEVQVDWDADW
jgi:16S rRNA processing protein RimM